MKELVLSAAELFYLARMCKGKNLDYDYVRMIPDFQRREAVFADDCISSLEKKGIISDNWGEIMIDEETREFLEPIWCGDFESKFLYSFRDHANEAYTVYFHGKNGKTRMVIPQQDGLHVSESDVKEMGGLTGSFLPKGYEERTEEGAKAEDVAWDTHIICKNLTDSGKKAIVEEFYLTSNDVYRPMGEGLLRRISLTEYLGVALQVLSPQE